MNVSDYPVATLSNGILVVNFSSPHSFKFVDGTVLDACNDARANHLKLEEVEVEYYRDRDANFVRKDMVDTGSVCWTEIDLGFDMSIAVHEELVRMNEIFSLKRREIVLVPLPVLQNIQIVFGSAFDTIRTPFRGIRVADRVSKLVHVDRFCRPSRSY